MKITCENKEFPYILIDDFYDQSELEEIWQELDYMCHPRRMARAAVENGVLGRRALLTHFGAQFESRLRLHVRRDRVV